MNKHTKDLSDNDIHCYVDGRLDPVRRAEVEALIAVDADAAEKARAYREQNKTLHASYDPVLEEPTPDRLRMGSLSQVRRRAPIGRVAAAVALLALGGSAGWFANAAFQGGRNGGTSLARDAVVAHRVFEIEVRHPVEVAASEEEHLVAWLSKRLDAPLAAPDLRGDGYELVGGRLLSAQMGPAAQLMYENLGGDRLTLYVRANPGGSDTAFRFAREGDVAAFYWLDGPLGYALIARTERERLLRLARGVYSQMNP